MGGGAPSSGTNSLDKNSQTHFRILLKKAIWLNYVICATEWNLLFKVLVSSRFQFNRWHVILYKLYWTITKPHHLPVSTLFSPCSPSVCWLLSRFSVRKWPLDQGVTLPSPCNSWMRLHQTPSNLRAGGSEYWKWDVGWYINLKMENKWLMWEKNKTNSFTTSRSHETVSNKDE